MKIFVIRHARFPQDPRVRKEVNALIDAGFKVDILCLKNKDQALYEKSKNLTIYRLPIVHKRGSLFRYIIEYVLSFFFINFIVAIMNCIKRYDCIQVNTMPDFLVFSTWIPKLMGTKITIDVHEPTPELFITKFGTERYPTLLYMQTKIESLALKYADYAFTVTKALKRRLVERGADGAKIEVIPNVCDDMNGYLKENAEDNQENAFTILTHGAIEKRYGHEIVIRAVAMLKDKIPLLRFSLLGSGSYLDNCIQLAEELNCSTRIEFNSEFVPYDELVKKIQKADVGIIAMYRNPYSELIDTNKMYEYIALKKTVATSRLPAIEDNFNDSSIMFFSPGNHVDLARCILELYNNPEKRISLAENAFKRYEQMRWSKVKQKYINTFLGLAEMPN